MNFQQIKQLDQENVLQSYGRYDVAFAKGAGATLWDTEGKEYLDFSSGIGVNAIGHAHPHWLNAITNQAATLAHVSNLFYTEPYALLASRLTALSGMAAVFFGNSGAEANEGAIKLARKYSHDKYGEGRHVILTLQQSFHGRTLAALTATGQSAYHQYFHPFVEGFRYLEPNDMASLYDHIDCDVCAILVEGVQGEGGVTPLTQEYVDELAKVCAKKDILLMFDEVQTGNGRTGSFYSYQGFGVAPDVVTTAKGLGGGLPIGAILMNEKCSGVLSAGMHGSTFGANPLVCAAANAVLDVVCEPGFLDTVTQKGNLIKQTVEGWALPQIVEVRGKGLMIGIVLRDGTPKELVIKLLENGMVALTAGKDVLRLLPPLTITEEEIDKGLQILYNTFAE